MSNPYDSVIDSFANDAAVSAANAVGPSPERAAKAIDLGRKAGVPPATIFNDLETTQDLLARSTNALLVRSSAPLQRFINSVPMAAEVASDDLGTLDKVAGKAAITRRGDVLDEWSQRAAAELNKEGGFWRWPGLIGLGLIRATKGVLSFPFELTDLAKETEQGKLDPLDPANLPRIFNDAVGIVLGRPGSFSKTLPKGMPRDASEIGVNAVENAVKGVDDLIKESETSKLRARDAPTFREFVHQQVGDQTIGIPAEHVAKLYETRGVTPQPGDDILGFVPGLERQLREALPRGGDVQIPLDSYAAFVKPEIHKELLDHLRIGGNETLAEMAATKPEDGMAPRPGPTTIPNELFLNKLFADEKSAGMTKEEFARYNKRIEPVAFEPTKESLREAMRLFESDPAVAADKFFDGTVKLDEGIAGRKIEGVTAKDGLEPDDVAPILGYQSGDELVADLARVRAERGAKTHEAWRDEQIAKIAQDVEGVRRGLDTAFNADVSTLLHDDLRVMQRQGGGEPLGLAELQAWAKRTFADMPMREARPETFIREVARAGRRAELALLKGKIKDAFKAKNEQLLSHLLAREATTFAKDVVRVAKTTAKFSKRDVIESVAQPYTDQIRAILARTGVGVKGTVKAVEPLSDFVTHAAETGNEVSVAAWLTDNIARDFNDLTVREFRELRDSLKSLEHVGREEKKIQKANAKADRGAVVSEIVSTIEKLPLRFKSRRGVGEAGKKGVYKTDALLARPEEIIDDLDLQNPLGPLNEALLRPLLDAKHVEDDLFRAAESRLAALPRVEHAGRRVASPFIDPLTEKPFDLTRGDVAMMALNLGSKRNSELLVQTLGAADRAQVEAFVRSVLTEKDWTFVEGMWKFFKDLKPEVDALYERLSGVAPDKVEPIPVAGREGGYVPIIHDSAVAPSTPRAELTAFEKDYHRATTANSYTKSRTEAFNPLLVIKTWPQFAHRIRMMLHDLAFREAVVNAQKTVYDPRIRGAIAKHYGPEYAEQFDPWLKYIANRYNVEDRQLSALASVLRVARRNTIVNVLGFNAKVVFTPNLGPLIRDLAVSPLDVSYMMAHWPRYWRLAVEKSGEIRHTLENIDRDINETLRSSLGSHSAMTSLRDNATRAGMYAAVKIDTALRVILWNVEYSRALKAGKSEADAIFIGEKAVRKQFGTHGRTDIPAIMRAGETSKTLTVFYGYMNTLYNRTRDIIQTTGRGFRLLHQGDYAGARRDFAKVFADSIAFIVVPTLFGAIYNPPSESDDFGGYAAKLVGSQALTMFPVVRDIANTALFGYESRASPPAQIGIEVLRAANDLFHELEGKKVSDRWLKHAINVPGYVLGLPLGQIGNSAQFLWNLTTNHERARTFGEFIHGLTYGRAREK